jgi:hypothetical protein
MSKNCLLCQKPLSRIRVGGGEDFCSREHRNQYRLRQGMNRLTEANKVANVMRRRENPRPIHLTAVTGGSAQRWSDYSPLRASAPARKTEMQGSQPKLQIHLPSSNGAQRSLLYPASREDQSRSFALLRWRMNGRAPKHATPLLESPGNKAGLQNSRTDAKSFHQRAQKGPALRVSMAVGLPLRQPPVHRYRETRPLLYGRLRWSDAPPRAEACDMAASYRFLRPAVKNAEPVSEVTGPGFRSGIDLSRTLGRHHPLSLPRRAVSMGAEPKDLRPAASVQYRMPEFQEQDIRRESGRRLVSFTMARPVSLATSYRFTSVPFAPQDSYTTTFSQEQAN